MRGGAWKTHREATAVRTELQSLRQKEQQLWKRFLARWGLTLPTEQPRGKKGNGGSLYTRESSMYESGNTRLRESSSRRPAKSKEKEHEERRRKLCEIEL